MKKIQLAALFLLGLGINLFAQDSYKLVESKTKNMVTGTSTLHDWRCIAEKQSGTAVIKTGDVLEVKSLTARIAAKSLKSIKENGKYYDDAMDKNAYKALEADKHPEIVYTLTGTSNMKTTGAGSTFSATGNLTIAGKTNRVTFPVKAVVNGDNITFTATVKFKLTAFGITPPKALMGTIKTGDDVAVILNSTFAK
ncbi:YceI family protein [Niabella sp. 22666]|uniref:YceI family protein n=1 Tax=Niabella sp. 22666 TaxID=3453954 RepID=UPI003F824714